MSAKQGDGPVFTGTEGNGVGLTSTVSPYYFVVDQQFPNDPWSVANIKLSIVDRITAPLNLTIQVKYQSNSKLADPASPLTHSLT